MKAVVVYYSLEGNTEYAARILAEELGADIIRIDPEKPYPTGKSKFLVGGKDATMKIKPMLKKYSFDSKAYDTVIIGTPLWAWTMAPPIRTFLSENDLSDKAVHFFVSSGGGKDGKCFAAMEELAHVQNGRALRLSLIEPLKKKSESMDGTIRKFAADIKGR